MRGQLLLYDDWHYAVEVLCQHFNGSLISGIRTQKHNQAVAGHEHSLHLVGLAADIEFDSPQDRERATRWAVRNGLFFQNKGTLTAHFQPLPPLTPDAP